MSSGNNDRYMGGEFVAAMEDVLDLYEETYDPQYPTVCLNVKLSGSRDSLQVLI